MRFLLVGYSSIGQRRLLPALASLGVTAVDVATRSRWPALTAASGTLPHGLQGQFFHDYAEALAVSTAEIVYISTVNSLHAELAQAALQQGRHVIVDKPITTDLDAARRLVEQARHAGRMLAEATVYAYHPQIAAIQRLFRDAGSQPTQIVAAFTFPKLPADNFRHQAALGGGALWDLGPYAVTPGRLFFDAAPVEVVCRPSAGVGQAVESGFSVLARYPGDRTMVGHFGMGAGYLNQLHLLGPEMALSVERIFTTAPDQDAILRLNQRNQLHTVAVPAADSFACFLRTVLVAIADGRMTTFADDILADAEAMAQLRAAAPG